MTSIPAADLTRLITRVQPHMATADDDLRVLHAVRLEHQGGHLYAVATDRRTMAAARYAVPATDPWKAGIPGYQVETVLGFLAYVGGVVEISAAPALLTLERAEHGTLRIKADRDEARQSYPAWQRILRTALSAAPAACVTSYSSVYLSRWQAGAEKINIWSTGAHSPTAVISEDGDFIGAQMPVTMGDEHLDHEVLAAPWLDALVPTATVHGVTYRLEGPLLDRDGDPWEYAGREQHGQPLMRICGIEGMEDGLTLPELVDAYGPIAPAGGSR